MQQRPRQRGVKNRRVLPGHPAPRACRPPEHPAGLAEAGRLRPEMQQDHECSEAAWPEIQNHQRQGQTDGQRM